jgi:deazaflavin-dependent oxidoreductase (nitroreductase family)
MILLLTTKGRKTGNYHTVAVQYELINGKYLIGAAGGLKSDWLRNLQACPSVQLEIGNKRIDGEAEVILEAEEITKILEYRLKRHPLMIRFILKMDGLDWNPDHDQLLAYARTLAFAAVTPSKPAPFPLTDFPAYNNQRRKINPPWRHLAICQDLELSARLVAKNSPARTGKLKLFIA